MVQPAESRKGLNLAFTRRANFCCTTSWRVLRQSKVSPVLMVIEQVGKHQSFEMPLIEDDHVVQQIASATSYPTLSNCPYRKSHPKRTPLKSARSKRTRLRTSLVLSDL